MRLPCSHPISQNPSSGQTELVDLNCGPGIAGFLPPGGILKIVFYLLIWMGV